MASHAFTACGPENPATLTEKADGSCVFPYTPSSAVLDVTPQVLTEAEVATAVYGGASPRRL